MRYNKDNLKGVCLMNKTGFGFLRLPRLNAEDETSIDFSVVEQMVDRYLELGGTYFDTAYTYLGGASEKGIRRCLTQRYPRERYRLADKLPGWKLTSYEQCRECFNEQLERCGVEWFDVYLIHWLNADNYAVCEKYDQFRFLRELKAEGKAKAIGFSYHDGPERLEEILTRHPEVDYVQLQINYLDWDSPALQARRCYEVAVKHGKKVIVMEPVKGGTLAQLPPEAEARLKALRPADSMAAWAVRFASSLEHVEVMLSGMSTVEQVEDNLRPLEPLSDTEREVLAGVADLLRAETAIPCTACNYCAPNCPMKIAIPQYFALYNDYARKPAEGWKMGHAYQSLARTFGKASACITCRACERNCPQKLPITDHLKSVAKAFE